MDNKLSKSQAGRLGGLALAAKYGAAYMSDLGARGGTRSSERVKRVPFGAGDFLLINRDTGAYYFKTLNGARTPEELLT